MSFTYETQGNNKFLVYKTEKKDAIDTSILGMLTNNDIGGLAQTVFSQFDDKRIIKYNITSKINAKKLFESPVKRKVLLDVFAGIALSILTAEEYMINLTNLLINMEYIFVDVKDNSIELICLPFDSDMQNVDLILFFKEILFNTRFDINENNDYVASLISFLNNTEEFTILSFSEIITKLQNDSVESKCKSRKIDTFVTKPKKAEPKPIEPVKQINTMERRQIAEAHIQEKKNIEERHIPIPSMSQNPSVEEQGIKVKDAEEKPMSLFYLLQHYSAKNKAIYNEQRKAKKNSNKTKKSKLPKKSKRLKESKKITQDKHGFAIPGQALPQENPQINEEQQYYHSSTPEHSNIGYDIENVSKERKAVKNIINPEIKLDFGDTKYISDDLEDNNSTVVLGEETDTNHIIPHLIRKKNNERIIINKPIFRLGRFGGYADYVVCDNKYVGNSHCHIIIKNGEYFVFDDNSRNHTYIDGAMIPSGCEVKIAHGQILRLANEEFEFKLF